jgi:hypothetical protein
MLLSSKNAIVTGILAPREFFRGRLTTSLGSDWTEARLGMFFVGVDAHADDLPGPSGGETVTVATVADYVTFGLKDSATRNLPGQAGGNFIGVRSTSGVSEAATTFFGDDSAQCSAVGYAGAVLANGGVVANGAMLFPDPSDLTGYNGFYCVKFVVNNRGSSIQAVSISVARNGLIAGDDYSKAALYQAINNASFGAPKMVTWNTGSAARALPDAAFLRIPFYNFRIRIQEIMAVKTAP